MNDSHSDNEDQRDQHLNSSGRSNEKDPFDGDDSENEDANLISGRSSSQRPRSKNVKSKPSTAQKSSSKGSKRQTKQALRQTEENLLENEDKSMPMNFQDDNQNQELKQKHLVDQDDSRSGSRGSKKSRRSQLDQSNQGSQKTLDQVNSEHQESSQDQISDQQPKKVRKSIYASVLKNDDETLNHDEREDLRSVGDESDDDSELTVKIDDDEAEDLNRSDELKDQPTFYNVPVRRQTIARMKALESDSEDDVSSDGKLSNEEAQQILLKSRTMFGGFGNNNDEGDLKQKYASLVQDDPELERKTQVFEFEFKPMKKFKAVPLDEEFDDMMETDEGDSVVMPRIDVRNMRTDDKVSKNGVEIVSVDKRELLKQELRAAKVQGDFQDTFVERAHQEEEIKINTQTTSKTLDSRKNVNLKIIKKKQERAIKDYKIKTRVLQSNFKVSVHNIIDKIKRQKHIVMQSYGPLVLDPKKKEKPIFEINKELDPEGYKWYQQLSKDQDSIPQALMIKMHSVRSMKDKVSSGHYMMMVSVLDAVGGNKFQYNTAQTTKDYRQLSRALKDFVRKKRTFLDKENRQMETKAADGSTQFVKAAATGQAFFNQQSTTEEEKIEEKTMQQIVEEEMQVNPDTDVQIDLKRNYSDYVRFNAKPSDENIDIKDTVSVLIPPNCDSTNVLMFELILLASEVIPRDYVVGWGLFPLVNSDFQLNEGKFKVPLLFGTVDPKFDKFKKIEEAMLQDLDKWLANFYFEIEKIKLMDIKVQKETGNLFYRPLGVNTDELNKTKDEEKDSDEESSDTLSESSESDQSSKSDESAKSAPTINTASVISVSDDEKNDDSQADSQLLNSDEENEIDKQARLAAEEIAEVVYDNSKLDEEINYDQFHFAVAEKYDLTTRRLTFKKIKYIADEVFLDLRLAKWRTIEFQLAILYILFLFYLRMFVHYTGQYMIAAIAGVPVTKFQAYYYYIDLEYAAWNFKQEVFIVVSGVFCNSIVFLLAVLASQLIKMQFGCYPRIFYKIICWHGIMTVIDPFYTLIIDAVTQNQNGDWFKFYYYYLSKQGSGIVGAYFSVFFILSLFIFNMTIFYYFMIFRYMNGRILDLYRRLSGQFKTFFMPLDNEVSLKYLQWVITRHQKMDCIVSSESKLIHDKVGIQRKVQFVTIYKHWKGVLQKSRLFFKDYDGSIIEVPQNKQPLKPSDAKKLLLNVDTDNATIYGENREMVEDLLRSTADKNMGTEIVQEDPKELESESDQESNDPRLDSNGQLRLGKYDSYTRKSDAQDKSNNPLSPIRYRENTIVAKKHSKLPDEQTPLQPPPALSKLISAPQTNLVQVQEEEDDSNKKSESGESDFL